MNMFPAVPLVEWREQRVVGVTPPLRGGHASQVLSSVCSDGTTHHTLVVFGGSDPYGVSFNDLYAIELPTSHDDDDAATKSTTNDRSSSSSSSCSSTSTWRCSMLLAANNSMIPPRMGHSSSVCPYASIAPNNRRSFSSTTMAPSIASVAAAADVEQQQVVGDGDAYSDDCMLIFGGQQCIPEERVFDDLYAVRLHKQWSSLEGTWRAPPLVSVDRLTVTGASPSPRHSHASTVVAERCLFVTGGATIGGAVLDDCFELQLETLVWTQIDVVPQVPREMLSACLLPRDPCCDRREGGSQLLVIFGGRSAQGQLLSDATLITTDHATRVCDYAAARTVTVPGSTAGHGGVCCHTLLPLSHCCVLVVGGLATPKPGTSPMDHPDTLLVVSESGAVPVAVTTGDQRSSLGFGHSSCSWQTADGRRRHVVVGGLVPDAASGSMPFFEVCPLTRRVS